MNASFSLFPKFYKSLSVQELAELVRTVGLDTVNLTIRKGYWCQPDSLRDDVPAFVKAMEQAGVGIHFCTAGFSAEQIIEDSDPLKVLADNGITAFRMGYFRGRPDDVGVALDEAHQQMQQVAKICGGIGIRCVYQVHHGTLIPSATGAHYLTRGLPAEAIGIMLDPGNQAFEGFEKWGRSAKLLGDRLVAIGVKDAAYTRDYLSADGERKGWSLGWAPLYEGVTDWYDLVRSLKEIDFDGTFVWMPFYHEKDNEKMTEVLTKEAAYLRRVVSDVQAE